MSRIIGALWKRQTQDGKTYLTGVLNDLGGDIQIAVFTNDRKEKENHPDYRIVLSEKRTQQEPQGTARMTAPQAEEINIDDIPF